MRQKGPMGKMIIYIIIIEAIHFLKERIIFERFYVKNIIIKFLFNMKIYEHYTETFQSHCLWFKFCYIVYSLCSVGWCCFCNCVYVIVTQTISHLFSKEKA